MSESRKSRCFSQVRAAAGYQNVRCKGMGGYSMKLAPAQIGKCGELLVQYQLLLSGIESAHLTTDTGIDLIAYSKQKNEPITIQVKANFAPKPGGGKGKLALDWWVPETSPADLQAFVDLSTNRVWLFETQQLATLAQQNSNGKLHLYMYIDPAVKARDTGKSKFVFEFEKYLLENSLHQYL